MTSILQTIWPGVRFCPKCDRNVGTKDGACVWCSGDVVAFNESACTVMGAPLSAMTPDERRATERRAEAMREIAKYASSSTTAVARATSLGRFVKVGA